MPARSRIVLQRDAVDRVRVIETLSGRAGAIGAMGFAICVLVQMAWTMATTRHVAWVLGPLALIEIVLLVMVVHQTWRKTLLSATPGGIELTFTSPLSRRAYAWPAVDIANVTSIVTANHTSYSPLAELRIQLFSGGEAQLFTDHPLREVEPIAAAIRRAIVDASVSVEDAKPGVSA
jgi:hypothetical protein